MAQFDIKYLERTDTHISYCYFRVQFVNPLYLVVNFYIIVIRQALIQSKENAQYSLLFIWLLFVGYSVRRLRKHTTYTLKYI